MKKVIFYPACRELEKFYVFLFFELIRHPELLKNNHFKGWYHMLMASQRIIEFPWVLSKLDHLKNKETILDIGSPKLLALFIARKFEAEIWATDLLDYFTKDLMEFRNILGRSNLKIDLQNARSLTYKSNFFDVVYSISVLEHISGEGDSLAIKEIERVLKPGGKCILTMPVRNRYYEELRDPNFFYYAQKNNSNGERVFFQRYYSHNAITKRILNETNLISQEINYVREIPNKKVVKLRKCPEGLPDSSYYFDTCYYSVLFRISKTFRIPFIRYLLCKSHIKRFFEFTDDYLDENLRLVFVELKKEA